MTPPPATPDPAAGLAAADPTARVVIVRGGEPDAAELAALALALTPSRPPAPSPGADAPPAWARAALLEGVRGAIAVRPSDLEVGRHTAR